MPPPKDPKKYAEWLRKNREAHIGKVSPFKGKKHKQEAIDKNREAHIGKVKSGKTRKLMSIAHQGQEPWNKNKTGIYSEERIRQLRNQMIGNKHAEGSKHTDEWKKWKSESQLGEKNQFYGKEHTEEFRLMISKLNTGKTSPMKNKHHTEETRALIRISRLNQVFPQKDSRPEIIMQKALNYRGISYEKHARILGQPDIFIKPNLCIFVDGDATHGNPRFFGLEDKIAFGVIAKDRWDKDHSVSMRLIKNGYLVLRIWQNEIEEDVDTCVKYIQYFIQRFLKPELEPLQLRMNLQSPFLPFLSIYP